MAANKNKQRKASCPGFGIDMVQVLMGIRQDMIQRYWKKLNKLVPVLSDRLSITNLKFGSVAESGLPTGSLCPARLFGIGL